MTRLPPLLPATGRTSIQPTCCCLNLTAGGRWSSSSPRNSRPTISIISKRLSAPVIGATPTIYRVADNWVTQWGAGEDEQERSPPLPKGVKEQPAEEYSRPAEGLSILPSGSVDPYSQMSGFALGWPVAMHARRAGQPRVLLRHRRRRPGPRAGYRGGQRIVRDDRCGFAAARPQLRRGRQGVERDRAFVGIAKGNCSARFLCA